LAHAVSAATATPNIIIRLRILVGLAVGVQAGAEHIQQFVAVDTILVSQILVNLGLLDLVGGSIIADFKLEIEASI
jgi:hypothetical protein